MLSFYVSVFFAQVHGPHTAAHHLCINAVPRGTSGHELKLYGRGVTQHQCVADDEFIPVMLVISIKETVIAIFAGCMRVNNMREFMSKMSHHTSRNTYSECLRRKIALPMWCDSSKTFWQLSGDSHAASTTAAITSKLWCAREENSILLQ